MISLTPSPFHTLKLLLSPKGVSYYLDMNAPELESFVESHLNLQVKISYPEHHEFLIRHGLKNCSRVLDVGTGNGAFVARLALDHPAIQFVGIDKRAPCIESCQKYVRENFVAEKVDMFAREMSFDLAKFDGFLLRYFLLHVDNAQKILELFRTKTKSGARFWIIDLDWSTFSCTPSHPGFDQLTSLVREFLWNRMGDRMSYRCLRNLALQISSQNKGRLLPRISRLRIWPSTSNKKCSAIPE